MRWNSSNYTTVSIMPDGAEPSSLLQLPWRLKAGTEGGGISGTKMQRFKKIKVIKYDLSFGGWVMKSLAGMKQMEQIVFLYLICAAVQQSVPCPIKELIGCHGRSIFF